MTREMLNKHAAETLHAAKRRTMDHHRAMLPIISTIVSKIKAHRQHVVHLHGAELPFAADDILDHEVDLRTIERSFPRLFRKRHAQRSGSLAARSFRLVPLLRITGKLAAVGITQTHAHAVVMHAQGIQHDLHQTEAAEHFLRHLFFGAEEMRIILRETTHAGQPVQLTALLPAIHRAEFGEAHGQVAIAARLAVVNLDVMRAVHRLQQEAVEQLLIRQHAVFGDDFLASALIELLAHAGRHST